MIRLSKACSCSTLREILAGGKMKSTFILYSSKILWLEYMAWNLFNNAKNRFYHRKTGFKVEKPVLKLKNRFYGGKTSFSIENLKTSRIQFQKW